MLRPFFVLPDLLAIKFIPKYHFVILITFLPNANHGLPFVIGIILLSLKDQYLWIAMRKHPAR